jgi:hypothetical protein
VKNKLFKKRKTMTGFLKFFSSFRIDGTVYPFRQYEIPKRGDSYNDFSQIYLSMGEVGKDMRKTAEKELQNYGK